MRYFNNYLFLFPTYSSSPFTSPSPFSFYYYSISPVAWYISSSYSSHPSPLPFHLFLHLSPPSPPHPLAIDPPFCHLFFSSFSPPHPYSFPHFANPRLLPIPFPCLPSLLIPSPPLPPPPPPPPYLPSDADSKQGLHVTNIGTVE